MSSYFRSLLTRYGKLRDPDGSKREASPKKVVKAWYLAGKLTEDDYLMLIVAIDDRNKLSHIYDPEEFTAIITRMTTYAALMRRVLATMSSAR